MIKAEPKWDGIPPQVRRLLEKCLQKDPRKRLRDIGDMPLLLEQTEPAGRRGSLRSHVPPLPVGLGAAACWL